MLSTQHHVNLGELNWTELNAWGEAYFLGSATPLPTQYSLTPRPPLSRGQCPNSPQFWGFLYLCLHLTTKLGIGIHMGRECLRGQPYHCILQKCVARLDESHYYRATLCVSAVFAVARCLSVRPSRSCIVSRRLKISSNFFPALPILGVPFCNTLCRRTTKFDVVTYFGRGVYIEVSHASHPKRVEFRDYPIFILYPLTQND